MNTFLQLAISYISSYELIYCQEIENKEKHNALTIAIDFLISELADGPKASKQIELDAKSAGISRRSLFDAKEKINAKAFKKGQPGTEGQVWFWFLPDGKPEDKTNSAEEYQPNPEEYHRKKLDTLPASNEPKGVNTTNLAEEYQDSAFDTLRKNKREDIEL